jgi:hypothetical protein
MFFRRNLYNKISSFWKRIKDYRFPDWISSLLSYFWFFPNAALSDMHHATRVVPPNLLPASSPANSPDHKGKNLVLENLQNKPLSGKKISLQTQQDKQTPSSESGKQHAIEIRIFGLFDHLNRHCAEEHKDALIKDCQGGNTSIYMLNLPGVDPSFSCPMINPKNTAESIVETIEKIIADEHISPEKICLYGHSMGGMFAIRAAALAHAKGLTIKLRADRTFKDFVHSHLYYLIHNMPLLLGISMGLIVGSLLFIGLSSIALISTVISSSSFLYALILPSTYLGTIHYALPFFLYTLCVLTLSFRFLLPETLIYGLCYPFEAILASYSHWNYKASEYLQNIPPENVEIIHIGEEDIVVPPDIALTEHPRDEKGDCTKRYTYLPSRDKHIPPQAGIKRRPHQADFYLLQRRSAVISYKNLIA